ncbi:MAG: sigma-54-dependent Fis family transcriptional regulator [Bacteroidales bacterium]|nr:sigma-54-dependent Fis family transcriptional regulator [Bacteroidales bacterium]
MEMQELQRLKNKYDIIGNDAGLNRALETAVAVAPTDLTVLITGESGVGKETIPQIIHQFSRRKTGKYLAVNCGAIPEGTINAELFGHEKGAFTGAIGERKGYFEEANGGTLFLDEIGELPRETQALLLRVLQNGEFMKVGSSKVEKTDVRVIAATNVNLAYAVATGKFREDLYYRLTGIQIQMPALRERNKDDIYLLFRKFTSDFSERYNLCKVNLNHDAISLLTAYRWPGNIRQLKNVAETVTALESRPVTPGSERVELGPAALMRYLPDEKDSMLPATTGPASAGGGMSDSDKQMIVKAILDLKQEVDRLKEIVNGGGAPVQQPVPTGLPHYVAMPADEPEEQLNEPEVSLDGISIRKASDELIERALAKHGGKVKPAAAELGISERTIYRKLAEWKEKGKRA